MAPWWQSLLQIAAGAATAVACEYIAEVLEVLPSSLYDARCRGTEDGGASWTFFVLDGGEVVLEEQICCAADESAGVPGSSTWGLPRRAKIIDVCARVPHGCTVPPPLETHLCIAGAEDSFRDLSSSLVCHNDSSLMLPGRTMTECPAALNGGTTVEVDLTMVTRHGGRVEVAHLPPGLPEFQRVPSSELAISGMLPELSTSPAPVQPHLIVFDLDLTLIASPMINLSVSALSAEQQRELFVDGAFFAAFCDLAHAAGHLMGVASFTDTATRTDISTCTEIIDLMDAVLPLTRTYLDNPLHMVCYPPLPRAVRRGKSAHIDRLLQNFETMMTAPGAAPASVIPSTTTSEAHQREEQGPPRRGPTSTTIATMSDDQDAPMHATVAHHRSPRAVETVAPLPAALITTTTTTTTTTMTTTSSSSQHPASLHSPSTVTAFELDAPVVVHDATDPETGTTTVPALGRFPSPSGSRRSSNAAGSPLALDRMQALFPSMSSGGGTGSSGEWCSGGGEAIVPSPPARAATTTLTSASMDTAAPAAYAAPPPILHGVVTTTHHHPTTGATGGNGAPPSTLEEYHHHPQLHARRRTSTVLHNTSHYCHPAQPLPFDMSPLPLPGASVRGGDAAPGAAYYAVMSCDSGLPVVLIDDDNGNCINCGDKARGFHCPQGFCREWYETQGALQRLLGIPFDAVQARLGTART